MGGGELRGESTVGCARGVLGVLGGVLGCVLGSVLGVCIGRGKVRFGCPHLD